MGGAVTAPGRAAAKPPEAMTVQKKRSVYGQP